MIQLVSTADAQSLDDELIDSDELLEDDELLSDDLLLQEDLLSEDDDLLEDDDSSLVSASADADDPAAQAHLELFAESRYPSANTCKVCHEDHYKEWSVSQHAYAQLSPIYMAMQNKINQLSNGTNGDFCIRCHNQVGMNMGESTYASNLERHPTSREGITCVVCHRVEQAYGKVSGRLALVEGDLLTKVYGPTGSAELDRVLDNRNEYRVVTEEDQAGRKIHTEIGHFPQIQTSQFCGSCHDVNLFNGFRLEEAFSEYKNSPAAARGESCQDCHMGNIQGQVSGYKHAPAAVVGGVSTKERKVTNHFFAGPDYSVIHPGIFPHNAEAVEMASLAEWLLFNHKAGWGTDEFEDNLTEGYEFPARWRSIDDRYDARAIINDQVDLLKWAEGKRIEVLRNGYILGDLQVTKNSKNGLKFEIPVRNGTDGHNVPTGFDAERLVWLQITVKNMAGDVLFQSGDLDPNGDLRDSHSAYVHNGKLPLDKYLFNLQSKFLTRNLRGGEREQVLAVNYSSDVTPFVRPFTRSLMLTGQPAGARKHRQTLPPLSERNAVYKVSKRELKSSAEVTVSYRLMSAAVPVNLLREIADVGFDFGMSAREVTDNLLAGHQVIWEKNQNIVLD
jgi:nitrate/TMAO reductase-like tetraheme cytochrome c subunit